LTGKVKRESNRDIFSISVGLKNPVWEKEGAIKGNTPY